MSDEAEYTFVPWVREGYRPTDGDGGEGTVGVAVSVEGEGDGGTETREASVDLALYGPGEATGVDHRQVVRTEPTPGTSDFPPNHFPQVEFDHPELPWLFSPEVEDDDGKLRPWLCLITVEQAEGVSLQTGTDGPAAVLDVRDPASPGDHLPDPPESWAWAHAQVVGADDAGDELATDRSEKTLSRLVSPRRLEPERSYYACVVPTYEPGRLAGLGKEPFERDEEGNVVRTYEDAWDMESPPGRIRLPVYYHWEFSTGKAGDFESLVRRLDPQVLEDVGVRQVDAGDPGPELLANPGEVVTLEGALRSTDISPDTYAANAQTDLVDVLDEASALAPESAVPGEAEDDRVLGPPIYGQWPPAASEIPAEDEMPEWLRDLNADPRFRVPGAFGTEVVQDKQEQLVAEAWRQVGEIREANQALRRARLAQAASQQLHDAMAGLEPAALLTLTEPAHGQTLDPETARTIAAAVGESALPGPLLSPAFRRITRPNGPLSRRLGTVRRERIVEDVNDGTMALGDDASPPEGAQVMGETLAAELCTRARARRSELEAWDFLGEAGDVSPATFVGTVRQRCGEARQRIETALAELPEGHDAETALNQMLDVLSALCGEGAATVPFGLDDLEAALDERDWEAAFMAFYLLEAYGQMVHDAHDSLQSLAESDDDLASLLSDSPGVTPALEAYDDALGLLWIRLILEEFFLPTCHNVRTLLECALVLRIGPITRAPSDRIESLRAEIEDLWVVLCGAGEDPGGLLAALLAAVEAGDTRRIRTVVAAMTQVVGMARSRLERIVAFDQLPFPGMLAMLQENVGFVELYLQKLRRRLEDAPWDPVGDAVGPRVCPRPAPESAPPLDLSATAEAVRDATDPAETIPARLGARLDGLSIAEREYPLAPIMAHPEFDEPMFGALRDLGQEKLVPGVGEIPLDSVGVLETNPAFIESYMVSLSHEMARELRWREYPTDLRGTYFRQFWDPSGRDPPLSGEEKKDIEYVHGWDHDRELGANYAAKMAAKANGNGDEDAGGRLVLVVRGALFDRYPNTHVYAAKGESAEDDEDLERRPLLPDPFDDDREGTIQHPLFRGTLDPDITFFGFDLDHEEAVADPGWFFVIEEPPSGPSFGLDTGEQDDDHEAAATWEDLTWDDVKADGYVSVAGTTFDDVPSEPAWGKNGAHMGEITWIRPFRAAIHADDMLPLSGGSE